MRASMLFWAAGLVLVALAGPARAQYLEKVYVPAHEEVRVERVEDPGHWVEEERWVEGPPRLETRWQDVEVPGHYETVERRVWVPGRWSSAGGASVGVSLGFRRFGLGLAIPIPLGTWVAGHHEAVAEQVWVPARVERRAVQVEVPGEKRLERVRVFVRGPAREVRRTVWVPGRWVLREASSPPSPFGR